jgi:hypothetical protein
VLKGISSLIPPDFLPADPSPAAAKLRILGSELILFCHTATHAVYEWDELVLLDGPVDGLSLRFLGVGHHGLMLG